MYRQHTKTSNQALIVTSSRCSIYFFSAAAFLRLKSQLYTLAMLTSIVVIWLERYSRSSSSCPAFTTAVLRFFDSRVTASSMEYSSMVFSSQPQEDFLSGGNFSHGVDLVGEQEMGVELFLFLEHVLHNFQCFFDVRDLGPQPLLPLDQIELHVFVLLELLVETLEDVSSILLLFRILTHISVYVLQEDRFGDSPVLFGGHGSHGGGGLETLGVPLNRGPTVTTRTLPLWHSINSIPNIEPLILIHPLNNILTEDILRGLVSEKKEHFSLVGGSIGPLISGTVNRTRQYKTVQDSDRPTQVNNQTELVIQVT
eukprot:sb/3467062/